MEKNNSLPSSSASLKKDYSFTNWAGNLTYSTSRLYQPTTEEELITLLQQNRNIKVLGSKHCFNTIADSTHAFISLDSFETPLLINKQEQTVTVGAGVKYGALAAYLQSEGYALHNLASLPHISVAGACLTATHGSGSSNGNLATAVVALAFITSNGNKVILDRYKDAAVFNGAVVNLGGLGILTSLTLSIEPCYTMQQHVYENLSFYELKHYFKAIMAAGYSVSLFTNWQQKKINEVWIKNKTIHSGLATTNSTFYGATAAVNNLHPIAEVSAENCTEQMGIPGPWHERLPHFKMGFTPSSGIELQSEYFVPLEQAYEAICAVEKLSTFIFPHLFISEIRTIAADDLWMSPCYQQPSAAIHFTWKQHVPEVMALLPVIETALAPFNARPHWGKLFTMPHEKIKTLYPKLTAFQQLLHQYDPAGCFKNNFLNTYIFGN